MALLMMTIGTIARRCYVTPGQQTGPEGESTLTVSVRCIPADVLPSLRLVVLREATVAVDGEWSVARATSGEMPS